jgi:cleavage stimulation factor subunit 3
MVLNPIPKGTVYCFDFFLLVPFHINNFDSFLLHLAYAECLENDRKFKEVHDLFSGFLTTLARDLEDVEGKVVKNEELNDFLSSMVRDLEIAKELNPNEESSQPTKSCCDDLYSQKQSYGVIYIAYLRFTLRAEGLNAFRSMFTVARKDKWIPWEVYEIAGTHLLFIRINLYLILFPSSNGTSS